MKIHQLPDGARFEYEGVEYVKSGPLFATGPHGQRLIPRHAVLRPLDAAPQAASRGGPAALPRPLVLRAIEGFYAECTTLVPREQRLALEAARERCLRQLG